MSTLPDFYIRPSPRCVICTVPFDEQEKVALVTGADKDYYEWTWFFEFPAARATLECSMFSRNGKRKRRLCYNPSQCSTGLTFHLDCFRESKDPGTGLIRHLEDIWRFGLWARPWKAAPSLDDFEASQPIPYALAEDEVKSALSKKSKRKNLLWQLHKTLPPEIQQMILKFAYGSPIWSIFTAREMRNRLRSLTGDPVTLSLLSVKSWNRFGDLFTSSVTDIECRKASGQQHELDLPGVIITIAIDNFGIKSLEVSRSWPSAASNQAKSHEVYIVERISDLSELRLEKQGLYCRFQEVHKPLRLWDTPAPPPFDSCHFKDKETSPLRLKTIKLDTSLKGLSVFSYNGFTYGIYPHYNDDPSSILDIFNQFPLRRRETLIWLFCPLAHQQIKDVWLRYDTIPLLPPILVFRTTRDQIYTFGPYRTSGCNFQYLGSTPSHIVSESVPLGKEIPAFGIATEVPPELCELPQSYYTSSPPLDIEGLYYRSAALENIQYVTSYCIEGYCIGILIEYFNGLQQPLGQCRPDASKHKVETPFGFHHLSVVMGQQQKEIVRLSTNLEEYQDLEKPGWESTKMNGGLTWWCNNTSSFCSIFTQLKI